jgi:hypothetical protein
VLIQPVCRGAPHNSTLGLIMSWRPRFHELKHPPRLRPRRKERRDYFKASRWPTMPEIPLIIAVTKLALEERLAVGPARVRYRAKRLRAIAVFRGRFTRVPKIDDFAEQPLPRLGDEA